jgi:hypothetical protein
MLIAPLHGEHAFDVIAVWRDQPENPTPRAAVGDRQSSPTMAQIQPPIFGERIYIFPARDPRPGIHFGAI